MTRIKYGYRDVLGGFSGSFCRLIVYKTERFKDENGEKVGGGVRALTSDSLRNMVASWALIQGGLGSAAERAAEEGGLAVDESVTRCQGVGFRICGGDCDDVEDG